MDKDTRAAIRDATQDARRLLEADFSEQLQGDYDIMSDGRVGEKPGAHLIGRQKILRARIVAAIEHKKMAGMTPKEAVADYLRDAAFTTLNRFVALKILEARGLVLECITKGEASSGFVNEFCAMAPGVKFPDGSGYRLYIESVFDELSTEVKVLFDRRDPASALWPRKAVFEELLEILNADELKGVWIEDETIGWVYQYFNSGEERRKMRNESQVPRNSRELAIRNQFFTPHYVVQFLSDNTMGRIWYEMRKGDTTLKELCEFMVRQPGETFAQEGEDVPAHAIPEGMSQEELWTRPIKVQHRPKKDPRAIRAIDPACGSGHFLLYLFGLLLVMYEEAWTDDASPAFEETGRTLCQDYPSIEALRLALPGLILAHNLHGVDIDPRCAQIAQLALWMRAQRAYGDAEIPRGDRPLIRRSNIVIAEPMPGDVKLVEEFAATLRPPLIGDLFREIVAEMRLAGEMGSLLPIERKLAFSIDRARKKFVEQQRQPAQSFLPGMTPEKKQEELDLSGIDDASFFEQVEEQILSSLRSFVHDTANGIATRRQLFLEDTEQGIAFIELAQSKFDVVLMNPPFGDCITDYRETLKAIYDDAANDLFAAFVARGLAILHANGLLGAITSRTGFFVSSLKNWRAKIYSRGMPLFVDFGKGVMDDAMVEAAAYCIGKSDRSTVMRLLKQDDKGRLLVETIHSINDGKISNVCFFPKFEHLAKFKDSPFAYWVEPETFLKLSKWQQFEPHHGDVRKGLRTGDNFRFVRAYWELPPEIFKTNYADPENADGWVPLVMTGTSQPWYSPIYLALNWKRAGRELRAFVLKYGSESRLIQAKDFYFKPGFSWTHRASRLFPYEVPPGCIFTGGRTMAFPRRAEDAELILAIFASRTASSFLRMRGEKFSWPKFAEGMLKGLPVPDVDETSYNALVQVACSSIAAAKEVYSHYEPFLDFRVPYLEINGQSKGLSFEPSSLMNPDCERLVSQAYGLTPSEAARFEIDLDEALSVSRDTEDCDDSDDGDEDSVVLVDNPYERALRIISYAIGCSFGRWDIRAMERKNLSRDRESTGHLPNAPVGMLPCRQRENQYPIKVVDDGILVSDTGHPRSLRDHIQEICRIIGVEIDDVGSALGHDVFRSGEVWAQFFRWHINTYSLGRRKAPIYWQISTKSARYSVFIYVHAFTKDTLFRVGEIVAEKLRAENKQAETLKGEMGVSPTSAQRKVIEAHANYVDELAGFLNEIERVAPLWDPQLEDGIIINAALIWRLFPQNNSWQKDCRTTWERLIRGDFDWSHLSMRFWPERVLPKCAEDRSLAIAHGLEDVFWFEDKDGKWKPLDKPARPVPSLIGERTSPAVKAALKSLLEAPDTTVTVKRGRKAKTA